MSDRRLTAAQLADRLVLGALVDGRLLGDGRVFRPLHRGKTHAARLCCGAFFSPSENCVTRGAGLAILAGVRRKVVGVSDRLPELLDSKALRAELDRRSEIQSLRRCPQDRLPDPRPM